MSDVAARLGLGACNSACRMAFRTSRDSSRRRRHQRCGDRAGSGYSRPRYRRCIRRRRGPMLGELRTQAAQFRICTKTLSLRESLTSVIARARRSAELLGGAPIDALLVHSASDLFGKMALRFGAGYKSSKRKACSLASASRLTLTIILWNSLADINRTSCNSPQPAGSASLKRLPRKITPAWH